MSPAASYRTDRRRAAFGRSRSSRPTESPTRPARARTPPPPLVAGCSATLKRSKVNRPARGQDLRITQMAEHGYFFFSPKNVLKGKWRVHKVAFQIAAKRIGISATAKDCRADYWLNTAIRVFHVSTASTAVKVQENVSLQLQQVTLFFFFLIYGAQDTITHSFALRKMFQTFK